MRGRERRDRREALVGRFLTAEMRAFNYRWSSVNPDGTKARAELVRDAFDWADAVIAESDRREKDGE